MSDPVDHPAHYTMGGVEVIDAIEAWGLGFNLGNAVKYLARAGKKDPARTAEDLKKAAWYIRREIARQERASRARREDLIEHLEDRWKKLKSEPPVEPTP